MSLRSKQGRVHLAVLQDGHRETLRLKAPLFDQDWQNEVAESAANTARGVLGEHPTPAAIADLAQRTMGSLSRLTAGMLAGAAQQDAIACKAGCDHCCHVVVRVTAAEALAIYYHLRRTLPPPELARLASRVAEALDEIQGLSPSQRFAPEYPCVFLDADRCSIYEARPLACRGMNSLDAKECETRLFDVAAREQFASQGGGRLFVELVLAFHAVSAGLQLGLSELYGLDMRPLELTAALHVLLEGGEPVVLDWLDGGRPFDAARE